MEGLLESIKPLPRTGDMEYDIARVNAWCARSHINLGIIRVSCRMPLPDAHWSSRPPDEGIVLEL
jgi:hypothetical protein